MTHRIITVKGTFLGLYEWGPGWLSGGKARRWREYWETKMKSPLWDHVRLPNHEELLSLKGSIFLHPMDFTETLDCGPGTSCDDTLDELSRICSECAAHCGGSFLMEVSDPADVDTGNLHRYSR